jgi:hypothetical protein
MEAIKKFYGKKVIIRSYGAGVFFGTLNEAEIQGDKLIVELLNDRKLYYWDGACAVQEIADKGTLKTEECKFTVTVESQIISSVVEIIPCTEISIKVIEGVKEWKFKNL